MPKPASSLPNPESKRQSVQTMFDSISGRYDLLNRVLTGRLDTRWRKIVAKDLELEKGCVVADLACGTGDFVKLLNSLGHTSIGVDLSMGMLENSDTGSLMLQGDLLELPLKDSSVDAATCGFALRNLTELDSFFSDVFRTLKPGGKLGILEVSTPKNRVLATGHKIYFNKVVPFIGGLLSSRKAYSYLPESVSYLPETPELCSMLGAAGFTNVTQQQLSGGIAQALYATKPST